MFVLAYAVITFYGVDTLLSTFQRCSVAQLQADKLMIPSSK